MGRLKLLRGIYCSTAKKSFCHKRTGQKRSLSSVPNWSGKENRTNSPLTTSNSGKELTQNIRKNPLDIQMLSSSLHRQIFKCSSFNSVDREKLAACIDHLKSHGLWGKETSVLPDVDFQLPELYGNDLDEHFKHIALQQCEDYLNLAKTLCTSMLPKMPSKWMFDSGWTRYDNDGSPIKVNFPEENALIFDVEVLMNEGPLPVLATAVSPTSWYTWCSAHLIEDRLALAQKLNLGNLIPLETKSGQMKPPCGTWEKKVIVGHNVSFDRIFIKEQYFVKGNKTKFLDTMSLHIATSGLTGLQRALLIADQTGSRRKEVIEVNTRTRGPPVKDWMRVSCLNNLADVYKLHCKGPPLQKEARNIFVKGNIQDIRQNFQCLMTYCAEDVKATQGVLSVLLPMFLERFPHPVTFAGMLEMSTTYLPVNQNWQRYIADAENIYDELEKELKAMLIKLANDACELLHNSRYKNDPWLWDLDWAVQELKTKKSAVSKSRKASSESEKTEPCNLKQDENSLPKATVINPEVESILNTIDNLYAKKPHLAGYPAWYRELCPKYSPDDKHWTPGPTLISPQMQVSPKLLRLTWDGYPLHYSKKNGWGYLVPGRPMDRDADTVDIFPLNELLKICPQLHDKNKEGKKQLQSSISLDALWNELIEGVADPSEESHLWNLILSEREQDRKIKKFQGKAAKEAGPNYHQGNGPYLDEDIPGCWFFRLPHKDGPENRVGNPLAKDFLNKIEDDTLKSNAGEHADWALKMNKMISYWKNAHKRITSQIVIWFKKGELPRSLLRDISYEDEGHYGCILPKIITAGTVTRRAVEPTWLTASNAYVDRVGSELKAMVQAFPGYHFVGADVDSQELWIASILGDAHFAGLHGCTALGWMTLQGKKSNGTDMHSKTASTVGISRDQAKIMNYGRIYGAGQPFASRLLMQFNHRLTAEVAKSRAQAMYAGTKGVRGYMLNERGKDLLESTLMKEKVSCDVGNHNLNSIAKVLTKNELFKLLRSSRSGLQFEDVVEKNVWIGGTESSMFNKLEEIAVAQEPKTPVLECRISRALEPAYVRDNFMTSRVNWVVQSSAVDYLHLMLVAMRWLFDTYGIDGRFCISIHDEVRYLVKSEDRYRAAFALQITNLLVRCMFAFKLGMNDLPQSVAFFSAVDIDSVLRKEVHLDCKTPSNVHGLEKGYGIPKGEALDIYDILQKTKGTLFKS